jgi:trans-aconitate methyltransferase
MPPELDFGQRAELSEWMDEPSSDAELRACLRDLMKVNRTLLGYRPTLHWIAQFAGNAQSPLRIVDIGCGGGDMLRRIETWARGNHISVRLTGVDRNPQVIKAARAFSDQTCTIEWIACEAEAYRPLFPIDLVISSLFTHHLTDAEIVRFLKWMEQYATRGWFINDLRRGAMSYYLFTLLAWAMRWHRFVRHDGPVSIRRSFTPCDWSRYLSEARLPADSVRMFDAWPGRLCVARVK